MSAGRDLRLAAAGGMPLRPAGGETAAVAEADEADAVLAGLGDQHPAWPVDTVMFGSRARGFLNTCLRPLLPLVALWEQATRVLALGHMRIVLDAAGCYRRGP